QAEDGIRDRNVTGVQTCALPIFVNRTRTDDDNEPRIGAADDVGDGGPRVGDDDRGALADRDFLEQDRRRDQRTNVPDAKIIGRSKHGVRRCLAENNTPMPFLIRLLVNAAALWVATRLVPGVSYSGWPI